MLRGMIGVAALLWASAAGAADWRYENPGMPIAYADTGDAQFHFACRGGDLAMGFGVLSPDAAVAGATTMNLAITPDPAEGSAPGAAGSNFAQEIPLVHSQGSWMIVRGPVARQWARIAQQAKASLRVSFVRSDGAGKLEFFDGTLFGASGSAAAIKQVLDRCG